MQWDRRQFLISAATVPVAASLPATGIDNGHTESAGPKKSCRFVAKGGLTVIAWSSPPGCAQVYINGYYVFSSHGSFGQLLARLQSGDIVDVSLLTEDGLPIEGGHASVTQVIGAS